jgi:hypothetical protein
MLVITNNQIPRLPCLALAGRQSSINNQNSILKSPIGYLVFLVIDDLLMIGSLVIGYSNNSLLIL